MMISWAKIMGVWEVVDMNSLKYHKGLSCLTSLMVISGMARLQGWPTRRGSLPAGWAACCHLLSFFTPRHTPMRDGQEGDIPQHVSRERDIAIGNQLSIITPKSYKPPPIPILALPLLVVPLPAVPLPAIPLPDVSLLVASLPAIPFPAIPFPAVLLG
jgi:hypothetical protein